MRVKEVGRVHRVKDQHHRRGRGEEEVNRMIKDGTIEGMQTGTGTGTGGSRDRDDAIRTKTQTDKRRTVLYIFQINLSCTTRLSGEGAIGTVTPSSGRSTG